MHALRFWISAAVTVLVLALGDAGARAQEFGDVEAGQAFARAVCAACHAVEKDDALSPNPGAPPFRGIAAEPGMTAMALHVFLQTPHRDMPDLVLKPDEMSDVIAYILTLRP